jgi:uncharacterized protein (DUF433 family)
MRKAVQVDRHILGGTPCFSGTRVPVRSLFDHLKLGYTVNGFLEQFPTVNKEQVETVLDEAEHQIEDQVRQPAGR